MKILDDGTIAVFHLGLQVEISFAGGCRDLDESSILPIGRDDFPVFPGDAAGGAVRIDLLLIGLCAEQGAGFQRQSFIPAADPGDGTVLRRKSDRGIAAVKF